MQVELTSEPKRKTSKSRKRTVQLMVGLGLSLLYYSVILWFVGLSLLVVAAFARIPSGVYYAFLLSIVIQLMILVGKTLCLAVPTNHGKVFAFVALGLQCLSLLLVFQPNALGLVVDGFPNEFFAYVVSLSGWLVYLVFLRKLCEPLKQPGLTHAADQLYNQAVTFFVVVPLFLPILMIFVGPFVILVVPPIVLNSSICLINLALLIRFLFDYLQLLSYLKITFLR